MKAVIDTSSLVSLVRYYLPFDHDGKLKDFLEEQVVAKNIIVLDKVVAECRLQGKGQVLKVMPFLEKAKNKTSVTEIQPNKKLYNMIDNNFINGSVRGRFPEAEYQHVRNQFIDSADFALVLYAFSLQEKDVVVIVTEETGYSNDGKPFKKIPEICKTLEVPTMNLPTFLSKCGIINLSIDVIKTTLF